MSYHRFLGEYRTTLSLQNCFVQCRAKGTTKISSEQDGKFSVKMIINEQDPNNSVACPGNRTLSFFAELAHGQLKIIGKRKIALDMTQNPDTLDTELTTKALGTSLRISAKKV